MFPCISVYPGKIMRDEIDAILEFHNYMHVKIIKNTEGYVPRKKLDKK